MLLDEKISVGTHSVTHIQIDKYKYDKMIKLVAAAVNIVVMIAVASCCCCC